MKADEAIHAAIDDLVEAMLAALATRAAAPPPADRLLSINEAAQHLAIGRTALYRQLGRGRIRSIKVGRRRLIPASAIADYIAGEGEGRPSPVSPC
jgi:excisionase family DNA binding protein